MGNFFRPSMWIILLLGSLVVSACSSNPGYVDEASLQDAAKADTGVSLYAANEEGSVTRYSVGGDGGLTQVGGISGLGKIQAIAATPDGKSLFAGTVDGDVWPLTVEEDGGIVMHPRIAPPGVGAVTVNGMSVSPDGKFLYVGMFGEKGGMVVPYTIHPGGLERARPVRDLGDSSVTVVVNPDGTFIYAGASDGLFPIEIRDGVGLIKKDPVRGLNRIINLTLNDANTHLYATTPTGLVLLRVDSGGGLIRTNHILGSGYKDWKPPTIMTPDQSGLYISSLTVVKEITPVALHADGGMESRPLTGLAIGFALTSMAITPDGRNLYTGMDESGQIIHYEVDPETLSLAVRDVTSTGTSTKTWLTMATNP